MTVYYVGPTRNYTTINSAFSAASNGDTILIDEGTYNERIYFNNKIVNLIGLTDHPEEGKVVIAGTDQWGTIQTLWNKTASMDLLIEGIKIQNLYSGQPYYLFYHRRSGSVWSGLNVTINKCILDSTNFGTYNMFYSQYDSSNPYYALNSLQIKNCDIYTSSNKFIDGNFAQGVYSRKLNTSRISSTPQYTEFSNPNNDYIGTSREYTGYGPKYEPSLSLDYPEQYAFTGQIKENGAPVSRELRFFRRDNDVYLGSTISNDSDGSYYKTSTYAGEHYIICLDHSNTPYYNDLIKAKCIPVPAAPSSPYRNVALNLANPIASTYSLTGWDYDGSNLRVYGAPAGYVGSYCFGRHYSGGTHTMTQRIDLIRQGITASGIDAGNYYFQAKAMKHCEDKTYGDFHLGTALYDENELLIGSDYYTYEETHTTAWTETIYTRAVISGTRYIDLSCRVVNSEYWVSTFFDDIHAFIRVPETVQENADRLFHIDLKNAGADWQNIGGWTSEIGSFEARLKNQQDYYFNTGTDTNSILSQRVDLIHSGVSSKAIDDGNVTFNVKASARLRDFGGSDKAYIGIRSVDENITTSGTDLHLMTNYWDGNTWFDYEVSSTLASGTRYVDVLLQMYSPGNGVVFYDDIQPFVTISGTYPRFVENFIGTDGDVPDTEFWTVNQDIWNDGLPDANVTIQNNKLDIPAGSTNGRGLVISKFYFPNNFDFQVDADATNCDSTNYLAAIYFWIDEPNRAILAMREDSGSVWRFHSSISDVWSPSKQLSRTNNYGTLRMIRVDNQLTFMVKDGTSSWQELGTESCARGRANIVLYEDHSGATTGTTTFDNLIINSGDVRF